MDFIYLIIFLIVFIYALVITYLFARKIKPEIIQNEEIVLVDTSALIDGRIKEIAKTGFVSGTLLVGKFILDELQAVSDSNNHVKRQKGRRGIRILRELQKSSLFDVKIIEDPVPDVKEVDDKLIHVAKKRGATIMTVDYNLNRIADIQGVHTLNVNELANSIKPAVVPGEKVEVKIVQKGKERDQGVGYLEDGTMIVVESGQKFHNKQVKAIVSRILQTDAGL
ncbi:unnamed protein product, partial [marine sediment metagenome]